MQTSINQIEKTSYSDWGKKFTQHEQDSDSKFYDDKALDRVVELEYVTVNGVTDYSQKVALSRTRIISINESITGRREDEAWSLFCQTH